MAAPPLIERLGPALYELPTRYREGMRVPVRVFATEKLLAEMDDKVFEQAANVATLPGIVEASFAMPDATGVTRQIRVEDAIHNTAKLEQHQVGDAQRTLLVHRKGATRAFPPGHPELPDEYRETGQPVIIGGSMETGSYVLAGIAAGAASFYSTAHGSGRTMSRTRARKLVRGRELRERMEARGIFVRSASYRGLAEEAGFAFKSVDEVAGATELAGLSRRVAHLVPVASVKG